MTLSSLNQRAFYSGDGSNKTFAIPFNWYATSDIEVWVRDNTDPTNVTNTLKTIVTHYAVSGFGTSGNQSTGGNVVFGTAPTSNQVVLVRRIQPLKQLLDLVASGPFAATSVEDELDKIAMMLQLLNELITRAPKFPVTWQTEIAFPEPSANGLLAYNAAATALVTLPQTGLLLTQNQYRAGNATLAQGLTSVAIVFSSVMSSTSYSPVAVLKDLTDSNPDFQQLTITAKSVSGFTVSWNDPTPNTNYAVEWAALGYA